MSDGKTPPEPSMEEILASIRRIIAEDEGVAAPMMPRPGAPIDVLDLTEALNDDGTVRYVAPFGRGGEVRAAVPPSDGRVEPTPPRAAADIEGERLVSSIASGVAAASFARLASVPREPRREGERSLEDLVRDMLRPLLQTWLDENLPGLVERLVRAEIARVVGEAGRR
jgi:cell pole-organizing protein PopZ